MRTVQNVCQRERKCEDFILNAPGRVAMTTDNWKSDSTNDEYICVTTHFVDSN